ncbi:5'-nucleotidase C-terminal domain-containing protein [Streptomyces lunaelactis]|uniref:5'-nucleotidase C-terminal domain-containing protein n=1 Tax=Streptomyces lunaelactis TaxID=1535768 RepID=UPI001584DFA8|nr:5'-nucleotidase C-terminal domain-containing protein [Streptomyces lunaelactis]NUK24815.1 5'-nucleotidase C-terminal domain-containing protein [Streptomyces lunaelactis]
MGRYDLALIGFGGVNRALAELISQRGDRLAEELGFGLRVVAITDLRAGSLVDTDGIDLAPLLAAEPGELSFAGLVGGSADPRNEWVIREVPTDIVVEATFLSAPLANRIVGSITADITRSETRDTESDLANLVADAQLAATSAPERGGAQLALMNPGGVRADMVHSASTAGEASGEITYAEAFAVQPFSGSIVSMNLTGAQIEQILEEQFNSTGTRAPTLILGVSLIRATAHDPSRPTT